MGAAAEHRGNELIRRQCREAIDAQRDAENAALALQVSEDCNAFTTQAMGYLIEPKGLRQNTVERAKLRRGWGKRHTALCTAHNAWVDTDSRNAYTYHAACVRRAKAAHNLLIFALGCWTIPDHITVPRAAT